MKRGKLLLLAPVIAGITAGIVYYMSKPVFPHPAATPPLIIAHAGGGYEGRVYTDSIAALNASYVKGYRFLEMDIIATSDGKLVCGHDWKRISESLGLPGRNAALSYAEFTASTSEQRPCTLQELADWMRAHPDAYLIADMKSRDLKYYQVLFEAIPDAAERVIAEIWHSGHYEGVKALGFKYLIGVVFDMGAELQAMMQKDVFAVATDAPIYRENTLIDELARRHGRPLLVFTVNACAEMKRMYEKGASGFYTDFIAPGSCTF